jgi:hypothetical protein
MTFQTVLIGTTGLVVASDRRRLRTSSSEEGRPMMPQPDNENAATRN